MTHPRIPEILPEKVIANDCGCGDLSAYVRPGELVLDLRSTTRVYRNLPVADGSVDAVISDGVLDLVHEKDKVQLIRELFRVLKPNGRLAISAIVAGAPAPGRLKGDSGSWRGFICGAFVEAEFVKAFADAGFEAVRIDRWAENPWQVVEGIQFRSVTLTAIKGTRCASVHRGHMVIYRGPYAEVRDGENQVYPRGERVAVCERTFRLLAEGPYKEDFIALAPACADPAELSPYG